MEKQINKNHNNQSKEEEEESAHNVGSSIFTATEGEEGGHMINFADQFKDKVLAIHEHFDKNKDGFLNFDELSALQLCTSGQVLDSTMYGYICQGLGCAPSEGLHLDGLKLTYASDGANVDDDYDKVFAKKKQNKESISKPEVEEIFEVGDGGVDISPQG